MSNLPVRSLNIDEALNITAFPSDIAKLHAEGKLTNTKLSDLIRLRLLSIHGGTWLDSTVLVRDFAFLENLTSESSELVWMPNYRPSREGVKRVQSGSSWALFSPPGSHWTSHMIHSFEKLIRSTSGGLQYFDFHHIAAILDENCAECHASMMVDSNAGTYGKFHNELYKNNGQQARKHWQESFMHKLSYKTFVFTEKHRDFLEELFESDNN